MLVTCNVGQKVPNTVAFFDANGQPTTQVDAPPVWSIADSTVATIDQTGLVTALKAGTTTYTITDTAGGVVLTGSPITLTVAVVPPPPPGPATTFVITPGTPA
jgi:uncharacterized protein YjdB